MIAVDASVILASIAGKNANDVAGFRALMLSVAIAVQSDDMQSLDGFRAIYPEATTDLALMTRIESALGLRGMGSVTYCIPSDMSRYGYAELAQRSVNADEAMVSPATLQRYVTGDDLATLAELELKRVIRAFWSIAQAIGEATREIDQFLSGVVATPLEAVPPNIRDICCRIARYRLARYDHGNTDESRVYRDYKQDTDYLSKVAEGKILLSGTNNNTSAGVNLAFRGYAFVAPTAIYNKVGGNG